MYVIARHTGEEVLILDGTIRVKVLSVVGNIARLGIEAPREVTIERVQSPRGETPDAQQED